MVDNKKKAYYFLKLLSVEFKKNIIFRLSLNEEKMLEFYKPFIDKELEKKIQDEIKLVLNKNYIKKNNSFNTYAIFFLLIFIIFFILLIYILIGLDDGVNILQRLINSGIGHFLILLFVLIFFFKKLKINVLKELKIKNINALDVFSLIFIIIILVLSLFFANLFTNKVPFDNTNDYFVISLFLLPVVVPITEELIFRRYIYRELRSNNDRLSAFIITAVLFSLVHNPFNFVVVFVMFFDSILLTILYEIRGNLLMPMIAHSLSNLLILILRFFLS